MNKLEFGQHSHGGSSSTASIYCMGTLVADEASRSGHADLAKSIEDALSTFLSGLPRDEQRLALRLSYEIALGEEEPAPPRLRLVYSRN